MSIPVQFLRHPRRTGAIAASSRALARRLTDPIPFDSARTLVELGPGTGVVTRVILARMHPEARLTAVELDPALAAAVRTRFAGPGVEVHTASAADLAALVDGPVDAVVSGLPWAAMTARERAAALDAVGAVLRPGGAFTTFAYLHAAWTPPARRLAAELHTRFASVRRSPVIWANTPPAFVYRTVTSPAATDNPRSEHPVGGRPAEAPQSGSDHKALPAEMRNTSAGRTRVQLGTTTGSSQGPDGIPAEDRLVGPSRCHCGAGPGEFAFWR